MRARKLIQPRHVSFTCACVGVPKPARQQVLMRWGDSQNAIMVRVRVVILVLLYLGVIRSQLNFRGRSNQIDLDAVKMIIVLSIHVFPSPLEVFHSGILPLRIIRMVFNSHRSSSILYWWLKLFWRWTRRHDTLQIFKHPCSIITPLCFHYASF